MDLKPEQILMPIERIQGKLIQELIKGTGDPDHVAAEWLVNTTPLGIDRKIEPGGVFPELTPEDQAEAARKYATPHLLRPDFQNYTSYLEEQLGAVEEPKKEKDKKNG